MNIAPILLGLLLLRDTAPASDEVRFSLTGVYDRAAPAVVGIECQRNRSGGSREMYFGSGAIIDPAGLVLTSITVVPDQSTDIRVFLRGGHAFSADLLRTVPEKELSLLRIRSTLNGGFFPFIRMGESAGVRVGQVALSLGNAFHSIEIDDQVTMAAGLVSGIYPLTRTRAESRYLGPAIETSATVNDGMDGGPLLDGRGELIGLLSLNFSTNRWLGTAIPIDALKPLLAGDEWELYSDRGAMSEAARNGGSRIAAYIGIEAVQSTWKNGAGDDRHTLVWISRVIPRGPAERAGLAGGQAVLAVNGEPVISLAALRAAIEKTPAGSSLRLRVSPLETPAMPGAIPIDARPHPAETAGVDFVISAWGRF